MKYSSSSSYFHFLTCFDFVIFTYYFVFCLDHKNVCSYIQNTSNKIHRRIRQQPILLKRSILFEPTEDHRTISLCKDFACYWQILSEDNPRTACPSHIVECRPKLEKRRFVWQRPLSSVVPPEANSPKTQFDFA
jgi:hypothetical protein